jgi:hypothetical protein
MRIAYVCLLAATAGILFAQDSGSTSTGWIVIPAREYSELHGKAFPAASEPTGPPVDATLTRVDYVLRADGDLAAGRATLTIDVLKEGWVRVPVPGGLAVRDARMNGQAVSLLHTGNTLSVILAKTGRSIVELDVAAPVTSGGGEEKLLLPASAAGTTRAVISLARADVDLKVTGGLLADRAETEGATEWVGFARGNELLTFTWRRKMEEQKGPPKALRMRGAVAQLLSLSEEATTVSAEVNVDITQGEMRTARLSLPAAITVNAVTGANVADWIVKDGSLTVSFLDPVDQKVSFLIAGETNLPREGRMTLPLLRLFDTERESGGIAVEVLGAGEITNLRSQGLERTEAAELGAGIAARQSPSLVAFRYRTGASDRSLAIDVARYTQQAVLTANVEESRYRVLMAADGKMLVEARYAVRNNQRNFMRLVLPAGAILWSAALDGRAVQPGRGPDDSLLFPLMKSRAGEEAPVFAVEAVYLVKSQSLGDKGRATLPLPSVDLPISRTGLVLYHPPQDRVTTDTGSFHVQPFEPPISPVLRGQTSAGAALPAQSPSPAQALVDRYRARRDARRPAEGVLLRVAFPAVGPSIYLAGELTAENQVPAIAVNYQKDRKGGRQ